VASLGVVSPLFFPEKKLVTFFTNHRLSVLQCRPYLFSPEKLTFLLTTVTYSFHSGVTPTPFLPLWLHLSTILCKFSHKFFFFECNPLEGVTRGGPPSDTTENSKYQNELYSARVSVTSLLLSHTYVCRDEMETDQVVHT